MNEVNQLGFGKPWVLTGPLICNWNFHSVLKGVGCWSSNSACALEQHDKWWKCGPAGMSSILLQSGGYCGKMQSPILQCLVLPSIAEAKGWTQEPMLLSKTAMSSAKDRATSPVPFLLSMPLFSPSSLLTESVGTRPLLSSKVLSLTHTDPAYYLIFFEVDLEWSISWSSW